MPSLVIRLVSPPSKVSGYIKRYLLEVDAHCYCGMVSRRTADELISTVATANVRGQIAVLVPGVPFGVRWAYSHGTSTLADLDAVPLHRKDRMGRNEVVQQRPGKHTKVSEE